VLDDLSPGAWTVSARGRTDLAVAETRVELTTGAPSWIELRLKRPTPVHAKGRTTLGGAGTACQVMMKHPDAFSAFAVSDASGAFEISLSPGPWKGLVFPVTRLEPTAALTLPPNLRAFEVQVPEEDGFVLDLDLDALRAVTSLEELDWLGY